MNSTFSTFFLHFQYCFDIFNIFSTFFYIYSTFFRLSAAWTSTLRRKKHPVGIPCLLPKKSWALLFASQTHFGFQTKMVEIMAKPHFLFYSCFSSNESRVSEVCSKFQLSLIEPLASLLQFSCRSLFC
jgi:hypothetical protein